MTIVRECAGCTSFPRKREPTSPPEQALRRDFDATLAPAGRKKLAQAIAAAVVFTDIVDQVVFSQGHKKIHFKYSSAWY